VSGSEGFADRLHVLLEEARAAGELSQLAGPLADAAGEAAAEARPLANAQDPVDVPMHHGMVGDCPELRAVADLIDRVAPSEVPVLIQGDTGTGKELVAKAIHACSRRAAGPFLAENCAAVPANLLESELFGHKKGSFTGAIRDREGHFVAADGGTLFLDEIGDMPLAMQAKLLRALEESEVRPVGSDKVVKVDVRLVAATHRDLEAMAAEKAFRQDLFYRLNVVRITLPPLRERNGDVPHLVRYFLDREARASGQGPPEVAAEALAALCAYSWPGNVRQLENEVKRTLALTRGAIGPGDLSPEITAPK